MYFSQYFGSLDFLLVLEPPELQNLEIFPPYFRTPMPRLFRDFGN